jgi:glycerol-3-phosphate dehydrogenase
MLVMSSTGTTSAADRKAAMHPVEARAAVLRRLREDTFDVLVIGGGINGCGIARDAAMRGMSVALVEADDFASGTSSRSSRLVHGGVRYLEHGWFHLVFESSRERRILLRIAPHIVRPLPFVWPVYRGARIPLWKLRAGLALYDALALFRNVARSRRFSLAEVARAEPALERDGLVGGMRYFDAATDDARLTLANALSARDYGAAVVNHARVTGFLREGDFIAGALVKDELTEAEIKVRARRVVNAAGPWSDEIRAMDGASTGEAVRGTKGIHVSVRRELIGNNDAVTLLSPIDGRVMFVLPAGTHAIIGTTDTYTEAHPAQVRASEGDVKYLLESANAFFPDARLQRSDVVAAWAGIRPLIAQGASDDASDASREHALLKSPSGLFSITGGKLTTYRSMAAEVVDKVADSLGRGGSKATTHLVRLPGEKSEPKGEPIVPGLPYTLHDYRISVTDEMAFTLADLLIRRTTIAFELQDQARSVAPQVARAVAPLLGWSDGDVDRELRRYEEETMRLFAIEP